MSTKCVNEINQSEVKGQNLLWCIKGKSAQIVKLAHVFLGFTLFIHTVGENRGVGEEIKERIVGILHFSNGENAGWSIN